MFDLTKRPLPFARAAVLAMGAMLAGCAATSAQTQFNDVPVLVAGEDEDPTTVRRGSDIFKRVIAELRHGMKRQGFRMVDEESVAVDLGWELRDRRPKTELIQLAKLMTASDKANHRVRALVLFRVHAAAKDLGGLTKVQTRIDGEIYDTVSNEFIDTFEMPRAEYPAPAGCIQNKVCISETVGDKAREIAGGLGVVLARKLARYRRDSAGAASGGGAVTGDRASGSGHGMQTPYTVTLNYFDRREALTIIGTMADEFPGYKSHAALDIGPATRKYEYVTSAKAHKMEEWLAILLGDMNFDVDNEVTIMMDGANIRVDKIVTTPNRPRSADETKRFD